MHELNVTGLNPQPPKLSTAWKNGLAEHIKMCINKFGTQKKFADSIGTSPFYISKIMNGHFDQVPRDAYIAIADSSGYDKVSRKPERAVEFENTRERERIEHIDPDGKSKDLIIINDYLEKRRSIRILPADVRKDFIMFILQAVVHDLNEVTADQVC